MNFDRRQLLVGASVMALGATTSNAVQAQAGQEVIVGLFNSLTGPVAFGGVPIQNGMKLAFEQAIQSNFLGDTKIKMLEADTASEKAQAISVANQFIKRDNVALLMGPTSSFDAIAIGPIVNDNKTPMMSIGAALGTLAAGPFSFKVQSGPSDTMPSLVKYALDKGVRKLAIVFDPGNDGLVDQKDAVRAGMLAGGAKIVSEDGVATNEANFLALATKLASSGADGIYFSVLAEAAANMAIQIRQAGMPSNVLFLGPPTVASGQLMKIGGPAVEGFVVVAAYASGSERPLNKAFAAAYKARFNSEADNWAAVGYAAGLVGLQAIKDAGPAPTRQSIRDALAKVNNVPVPIGNGIWKQDSERNPSYGGMILDVKNGKYLVVE